jgi:putative two-component system response regulator
LPVKLRIVAVDDDDISLQLLTSILEDAGADVITASDGDEAMELIRRNPPHVVITDWRMPKTTGIDLCKWIRAQSFPWYIFVMILTGSDRQPDAVEALEAGCDEFLKKPIDSDELRVRLATAQRILALESRQVTLFAVARLAESRDPETGQHLERMRTYARTLALALGESGAFEGAIPGGYPELIYQTSPLHDVGKVGIPDHILLKPGRLTDHEYGIMKTHAKIGSDTLRAALTEYPGMEYLRMAHEIALTHHERFDGSGYPQGLKGEAIPLHGRIVALGDVYDALVSQRVYKAAYSHDVARSIILDGKGSHFDPRVVDAFLAVEDEIVDTVRQFGDSGDEGGAPPAETT